MCFGHAEFEIVSEICKWGCGVSSQVDLKP